MNHIPLGKWKNYAKGDINEDQRTLYEQHLYTCDQCMDLYMEAIESIEDEIPTIEESSNYTIEVISRIPFDKKTQIETGNKKRWYEKKVFHYVLAAAMTYMLMTMGVFSELTNITTQFEENQQHGNPSSYTESVLNKTTDLLDRVERSEKEEANDNE